MPFADVQDMDSSRVKVGLYFALQNLHPTLDTPANARKKLTSPVRRIEQGETEDNGVGCKGKNRAVQIVRYYHAVYQDSVNADTYHYEEALKAKGEQGF